MVTGTATSGDDASRQDGDPVLAGRGGTGPRSAGVIDGSPRGGGTDTSGCNGDGTSARLDPRRSGGSDPGGMCRAASAGGATSMAGFGEVATIACVTAGTLIATRAGEVPAGRLRAGASVLTRDRGFRELVAARRRVVDPADMMGRPELRPVRIRAGALAPGVPTRDLVVSPRHRILFTGAAALAHFDGREALVEAVSLAGRPGIESLPAGRVAYVHLAFDAPRVVLSNGAWTEAGRRGAPTLEDLDADGGREVAPFQALADRAGIDRRGTVPGAPPRP